MIDPFNQQAHAEGWADAIRLFHSLTRGEAFVPYRPPGLILEPTEKALGEATVQYSQFYGTVVPYTRRSTFALGGPVFMAAALIGTAAANASARRVAERMSAPQWRSGGFPRVLLTDQRLLICSPTDFQWLYFRHSTLLEFWPRVEEYALYLAYSDCPPAMLRGPLVPWLSVALASCVYPRHELGNLPFFACFPISEVVNQPQPDSAIRILGRSEE